MNDSEGYFSDGSERDFTKVHISDIRTSVESISNYLTLDQSDVNREILSALNRHTELLESIDHALYYKRTDESVYLARILIFLVVASIVGSFYAIFTSL